MARRLLAFTARIYGHSDKKKRFINANVQYK